ncbi:MAG: hypothetical protein H8K03_15760 [Nitrospira sp.]
MQFAQEYLKIGLKEESISEVKEIAQPASATPQRLSVEVNLLAGAEDLVFELRHLGFKAGFYTSATDDSNTANEHEGIWVGSRIPVPYALAVIKAAKTHWPFLRYVMILGDKGSSPPKHVHYRMFIGGATSVAHRNKLRPWNYEDFERLNEDMSLKHFHSYIRSFY